MSRDQASGIQGTSPREGREKRNGDDDAAADDGCVKRYQGDDARPSSAGTESQGILHLETTGVMS